MKKPTKKLTLIIIAVVAVTVCTSYYLHKQRQVKQQAALVQLERALTAADAKAQAKAAQLRAERAQAAAASQPVLPAAFNKQLRSTDDSNSLWVVVNKQRSLTPKEYVPLDLVTPNIPLRSVGTSPEMKLRQAAATALETMTAAAKLDGAQLMLASGYRSYNTQVAVYANEVRAYGQAIADTQSARPGFSEHQTGLSADLEPTSRQCEIADCFADTIEGKWLALHAHKYGFMIRYTPDKTTVTGYRAESWHFRYVGADLTAELQNQNITTLEEFFGLPAAPGY